MSEPLAGLPTLSGVYLEGERSELNLAEAPPQYRVKPWMLDASWPSVTVVYTAAVCAALHLILAKPAVPPPPPCAPHSLACAAGAMGGTPVRFWRK